MVYPLLLTFVLLALGYLVHSVIIVWRLVLEDFTWKGGVFLAVLTVASLVWVFYAMSQQARLLADWIMGV